MRIVIYTIIISFSILSLSSCKKHPYLILDNANSNTDNSSNGDCEIKYSPELDNSHTLLGIPDGAQPSILVSEKYLIDQTYYTISYSASRAIPNWVSWHLSKKDYVTGGRLDDFRPDPKLTSYTGFYQVKANSYANSGFNRGHNCPSGDRTADPLANSSTFLMTNMIPQAPKNNQGPWATFESYIRSNYTSNGKECYIIMGSYGKGGTGSNGTATTIDNGKITVPSNVWKIVLVLDEGNNDLSRINKNTTIIAVNMPNTEFVNNNWRQHITTVQSIENELKNATENPSYNLLSNLPRCIKDQLSTKLYQ